MSISSLAPTKLHGLVGLALASMSTMATIMHGAHTKSQSSIGHRRIILDAHGRLHAVAVSTRLGAA